jgi:hypothetical protein
MSPTDIERRPIPGHTDYLASPDGRIWSLKNGRLKLMTAFERDRYGHMAVDLTQDGKYRVHYVHRLVAAAFLPPPLPNHIVCHIDNDVKNNAVSNLCWGTSAQNSADMVSSQRQSRGSNRPLAKLTERDVVQIRNLAKTTPQNKLAKQFNVSASVINRVVICKTWRHVNAD